MLTLCRYLVLAIALYSPYSAAIVIDFEEIDNSASNVFSNPSLDSKGFNLSTSSTAPASMLHWAETSPYNADPGGVTYSHNVRGMETTLTLIGGGAFDLTSIDFTGIFNDTQRARVIITGYYQLGGSISTEILTDALPGLETFSFYWSNLSSVTWTRPNGWLQLDNIVVNAAEIPEPSSLALLSLGLFGLSYKQRNRARAWLSK